MAQTILVVDDDPVQRRLLETAITRSGMQVVTAPGGQPALDLINGPRGEQITLVLLDLDHFKRINDTMGHAAGDALLVEIAKRLASAIRSGDLAARLGGDEFAILMQCRGANYAALANRLSKSITKPLAFGSTTLIPSGTIGYTVYPEDASGTEDLLKNADRALYQAKEQRRGSWKQWKPESSDTERRRLADRK